MKKILIVDDDPSIGDFLQESLTKEGYSCFRAYSGSEALLFLERHTPDLVLLDLMLPGLAGEEVLPKIRRVPVIVLSAKSGEDSKVSLLLGGAVDYITKPFRLPELLARVSVALRTAKREEDMIFSCKGISLDSDTRTLSGPLDTIRLTRTESAILKLFLQNPAHVFAKSQMLDRIADDTPDCTESSLKIHISNLRKKLRSVSGREWIEAVWGIGFKFLVGEPSFGNDEL